MTLNRIFQPLPYLKTTQHWLPAVPRTCSEADDAHSTPGRELLAAAGPFSGLVESCRTRTWNKADAANTEVS